MPIKTEETPMKILSAEFACCAVNAAQFPISELPEIAMVGRSNVGKSSLINKLINRRSLARTSSQPGKTQTINFYLINESFYMVDLPGYGYAKVSKQAKEQWGKMIEGYLAGRPQLLMVWQLVDIRHAPSREDVLMWEWLEHFKVNRAIIATKADKISKGHWAKQMKIIRTALGASSEVPHYFFSTETGQGKNELLAMIKSLT